MTDTIGHIYSFGMGWLMGLMFAFIGWSIWDDGYTQGKKDAKEKP